MKLALLLLLALPLHVAAQYRPTNYGSSMSNANYQTSMRQAQMSTDFQRQQMERSMSRHSSNAQIAQWRAQREQRVAKQREAEQKATSTLTHLAHRQDSVRLTHPVANAQQAAARQKADDQQLAQLTVKNYRDVFLPGQVLAAEQARSLSSKGMQEWQSINKELLDKAWWSQQGPAQLLEKITAYRTTLTSLTTELLGFDPATTPRPRPTPSTNTLEAMRAKGPFDQQVATQFIQEAALVEKQNTSLHLVSAINDFNRQVAEAAARPEMQQDPQKMRNTVQSGLRDLNKSMDRYELAIAQSRVLYDAQEAVQKYATMYLPKNEKGAKKRSS